MIAGRAAVFERTFSNDAGPLDTDTETVAVTVYDGADAEAFTATAMKVAVGVYRFTATAENLAVLDSYSIKWVPVFGGDSETHWSRFEVVGDHYFTQGQARAFRGGKLADETTYPDQEIIDAREEIESDFEEHCQRAFVRRAKREIFRLPRRYLDLSEYRNPEVISVSVTDSTGTVALTESELADLWVDAGYLYRTTAWSGTSIEVHYSYGEYEVPAPIRRAALEVLLDRLINTDVPNRTTMHTDETGTTQYMTETPKKPFGIPSVDATLNRYREHRSSV